MEKNSVLFFLAKIIAFSWNWLDCCENLFIFQKKTRNIKCFAFTLIVVAGVLLSLQGSLLVFIALCDLSISLPTKNLKSSQWTQQKSTPKTDIKVKRDLNLEKVPDKFNVLDRKINGDNDYTKFDQPSKRDRNWELRSASGTRMPMVRPTGLKGFYPTMTADSEGCEAVCGYCKDVLSMRWAALCVDQCYKQGGGRAYDACYITFSFERTNPLINKQ